MNLALIFQEELKLQESYFSIFNSANNSYISGVGSVNEVRKLISMVREEVKLWR